MAKPILVVLEQRNQLHTLSNKVRGVCPNTNQELRDLSLDLPRPGVANNSFGHMITDSIPVPGILLAHLTCVRGVAASGAVGRSLGNWTWVPAATWELLSLITPILAGLLSNHRPDGVVGYHVSLTPIRSWDRAPVWSIFFFWFRR